jgi:polyphosphate kinase
LNFNWRVLQQANDSRAPLLERVRFLAITCANLDEFFQKRVGGLKRQEAAGVLTLSPDGTPPSAQLQLIRDVADEMLASMTALWEGELKGELARHQVMISEYDELTTEQRRLLKDYFREQIFPILTPLAADPTHPFPFISNLSLSLAVWMQHPERAATHFARIKVPVGRGRWVPVPESSHRFHFVPLEQVVRHNVAELFPGMEVLSAHTFRITRNADVRRDDEEIEDLLAVISEELRERRFAPLVRMEVESTMPSELRDLLARELELHPEDVYEVHGLLALTDCIALADLELPTLRYPTWEPIVPAELAHEGETESEQSIFSILQRGDLLVHHPYDSFSASVQRLVEEAADDPAVIAIKQTLYRTSENSPIVRALMRAAERGKQVAVVVELTARFDEARNIEWAQILEDAGVHVTYGLVTLKTHSKVMLVVRTEGGRPRTYCHVGTGNYHANTARLYGDFGLLTADQEIGADLVNHFHFLTGYAPDQQYRHLVVAPRYMRARFESLIRREIEHIRGGGTGRIVAKLNALDDTAMIQELYKASQAGVRIDLVVRGHCRLRPGVPGYSENIHVSSIVGRFLEHDRLYYFHNGGDPEVFIASADWRSRNLSERVEVMAPILSEQYRARLAGILGRALRDNRLAWDLQSDGCYIQRMPGPDEDEVSFQGELMQEAIDRSRALVRPWELRAIP